MLLLELFVARRFQSCPIGHTFEGARSNRLVGLSLICAESAVTEEAYSKEYGIRAPVIKQAADQKSQVGGDNQKDEKSNDYLSQLSGSGRSTTHCCSRPGGFRGNGSAARTHR